MSGTEISTARLILRPFAAADADDAFALDNDAEVMRYLNGGEPIARDVFDATILPVYLDRSARRTWSGFWTVRSSETEAFLGWVSLRQSQDRPTNAELGYRFRREVWGQGYATEAASALLEMAFHAGDLDSVLATTYQDNLGSQRVMQKLGMSLVRRFRMTNEHLAQMDTHHSESTRVWDGDDVEFNVSREDWAMRQ